tara:strand:+ start:6533 stop:6691 length:159 start_codon:yes stop_codon:yes gene_type:complete
MKSKEHLYLVSMLQKYTDKYMLMKQFPTNYQKKEIESQKKIIDALNNFLTLI